MRCGVCGGPEGACQEHYLLGLVSFPRRGLYLDEGSDMSEYRSKERVYGTHPDTGARMLVYAVGDPIPEDEARRQGLVATKGAKMEKPAEDKAVKAPPEDKAAPAPKPRRSTTRRRS